MAAGGGHAEEGFPYEQIGFDSGGAHGWAVVGFEFGHGETETESDDVGRDAHTGHADGATAIALEEIHGRKKKNKRTERLRLGAERGTLLLHVMRRLRRIGRKPAMSPFFLLGADKTLLFEVGEVLPGPEAHGIGDGGGFAPGGGIGSD